MKKIKLFLVILLILPIGKADEKEEEINKLKEEFKKMVGEKPKIDSLIDESYYEFIFQDAIQKLDKVYANEDQYFVYVDRNPLKQLIFVCFFEVKEKKIIVIGKDFVSTGNPKKGKDYFETPTGIFKNSLNNMSYRALGTKNDNGWMGLGKKGARVWDFGWQLTEKVVKGKRKKFFIRLLLHATDPVYGEPRLGKPDSKGCIRISHKLNEFLDIYGILDKEYEVNKHLKKVKWVLRKDRKPVKYQGQYLIVGDSRKKP
jgi:hypothetical protein